MHWIRLNKSWKTKIVIKKNIFHFCRYLLLKYTALMGVIGCDLVTIGKKKLKALSFEKKKTIV